MSYRTGTKIKRNLYEGDRLVGQCQTDEDAERIVRADTEIARLRAALTEISRLTRAGEGDSVDDAVRIARGALEPK